MTRGHANDKNLSEKSTKSKVLSKCTHIYIQKHIGTQKKDKKKLYQTSQQRLGESTGIISVQWFISFTEKGLFQIHLHFYK